MKYSEIKTQKEKINYVRGMLGSNPQWALRGLMRVYANQTAEEQNIEATVEHNGVGFTGSDAKLLSSFAEQVQRGRQMSPKQLAIIYKKMPKYSRQLVKLTES